MLAYSSINHAGFILLGLQAATAARRLVGASTTSSPTPCSSSAASASSSVVGGKGDERHDLERYRGLARRSPVLATAFAVLLLAQAGAPFTTGFFAKFYVVEASVSAHSYALAVIAMLSAAIAVFFYLRVVLLCSATLPAVAYADRGEPTSAGRSQASAPTATERVRRRRRIRCRSGIALCARGDGGLRVLALAADRLRPRRDFDLPLESPSADLPPTGGGQSRKLPNWSGIPRSSSFSLAITAWRSSRFFPETRTCSPWVDEVTPFRFMSFTILLIRLAWSALIPACNATCWRTVPLDGLLDLAVGEGLQRDLAPDELFLEHLRRGRAGGPRSGR